MAQYGDLNLIPKSHMIEEENVFLQIVFNLLTCSVACLNTWAMKFNCTKFKVMELFFFIYYVYSFACMYPYLPEEGTRSHYRWL